MKFFSIFFMLLFFAANAFSQPVPTITGPVDPTSLMPATLGGGVTVDQVYTTETGMTNYVWAVSTAGTITAPADPTISNSITVTWTDPTGQQTVSVSYTDPVLGASTTTVLIINYYPYPDAIDPESIPKYVDPLPHFAAGLRVDAKAGGNLTVKAVPVQQVALSTGTVVEMTGGGVGIIGDDPGAGLGNYAAYAISTDGGSTYGPAMWPAQTIEARQGFPLKVQYLNELVGVRYSDFNILADQTLMMKGFTLTGNPLTDPYDGPIPMVVHLHGGEMPSGSDGGPNSWFMPTGTTGVNTLGPWFQYNASSLSTYPNEQEATTLWFHPHDDGLTRINVYTGLAGFYFIRGADEEAAQLPGWSGDNLVQEVTPEGKTATFNGENTYLPEIEIAIQDRMFNTRGELYWPVDPPNPDIHPFWTPEFVGDVMTVNGKTWPYLSVAPRKYRFRFLEGCNARFLNMWLEDAEKGTPGPAIYVIGGEGGLLQNPIELDPANGGTLLMAPGQRYDVVIDFTGLEGHTYTLRNDANTPYPFGDPVEEGTTDQIMQFIVNGGMVLGDNSSLPGDLRTVTPLVKLTDFNGNLTTGVTPHVTRQLIMNEVMSVGGPASVLVNNAYFDGALAIPGTPNTFGGPTEIPVEGTTEIFQIINISADAHPIHIHLLQWQLVSRQAIDDVGYMAAYQAAWAGSGLDFPAGMGYPGGAGSPFPYNIPNADGAIGGNPPVSGFLVGSPIAARPEEQGWKDNVIVMPGEVTTFITRVAPTDRPINATPEQLLFPFDPSEGPGYVWHCHIVDHEDMSMMRPLLIAPSPLRYPQITVQPASVDACFLGIAGFSVAATSATDIVYQWQISTDNGVTWTNMTDIAPYSGTLTSSLTVNPVAYGFQNNLYRVLLTNFDGTTISNPASMTVSTVPAKPGNFTVSSASVNQGQINVPYSVPVVAGADTYTWAYTGTGVTINGNSNSVTLDFLPSATSGILSVTASNSCGISPERTIIITVNGITPMPAGFITFSSTVCKTQSKVVYSIPSMPNTVYAWTYSGTGASIKGTTSTVKIDFLNATSGTLSVIATQKGWGPSAPLEMYITVDQNCTLKSGTISDEAIATSEITFTEDNELKVYPNPTSGNVNFEFRIKDNARVVLDISNVVGTHIDRIFDNDVNATEPYRVVFEKSISPGIYFYHLKWNDQTITGKFIKTR